MSETRVLLVDDHSLVRAGMRALLENLGGYAVVGEAASVQTALEQAGILQPDVVLMDIDLREGSGIEATKRLRAAVPQAKVIILSMHASRDFIDHALHAGAAGYLLKDAAAEELPLAIDAVMRGEAYLSPAVSKQLMRSYVESSTPGPHAPAIELTPRQREILKLIAQGNATKEIAHELGISVKTVETHRAQLQERLGIRDTAGLVRYAIKIGLVKLEGQ